MSEREDRAARHNAWTLTGALLASLAIVVVIVLLTVRPDVATRNPVDWSAIRNSAPQAALLANPHFTAADGDWWANRADLTDGEYPEWYIGFVTPTNNFVAIEQYLDTLPPEMVTALDSVTPTTRIINGVDWKQYDRRNRDDAGNRAIMYTRAMTSGSTLIVSGTAPVDEIERVANLAFDSLEGGVG